MHNIYDFIGNALTHVDPATKLKSASYPISSELVGFEPWHYLFGTFGQKTSAWLIEYCWEKHYCNQMPRAKYDAYTAGWKSSDYATDCQGLLDAYLTYVVGEYTDINADTNYKDWCEHKGPISQINRNYVIGEAVFMQNASGKMHHIGWICGFMPNGEPLVIEARSIAYGVVITKLNSRNWTHRGLMTKKFDYTTPQSEPIKLELKSPMMQGDYVLLTQKAMNALGYTDADGKRLDEDGKCGRRTMEAVTAFADVHAAIEPKTITVMPEFVEKLVLEQYGLTVGVIKSEDMPSGGDDA